MSSSSGQLEPSAEQSARRLPVATLLDLALDAILVRDAQDRIDYWNQGAVEIYGYTREEALGQSPHTLLKTEFMLPLSEIFEVLYRDGRWSGELTHTRKGGEKVTVSTRWSLQRDAHGAAQAILETNRDITAEKRTEHELRNAKDRLNATLDSIADGLLVMDRDWRYTYFSDTAAKILEVRREDMLGKVVWDLFPHARGTKFDRYYRLAVETGKPQHFEEYYPEPLNQWLECHCYPSAEGLTVYFRDVTDRRSAQEALAFAEKAANVGAWDWVIENNVITWSAGSYALYEYPPDSPVTYDMWRSRLDPADVPRIEGAIRDALKGERDYDVEYRLILSSCRERWINARGEVVDRRDGRATRMSGINQDITLRRRVQQQIRESEEKLRLFIEHAPAAIAMFDHDMRYLAVSKRWRQDYSLPSDLVGRCHYEVFPEITEAWKQIHQRALAGEVLSADEDLFVRSDGSTQWIKWDIRPWYAAEGYIGGILIAAEDITGRVESERKIRESEAQFRTLANAIPQLCWMANADGWIFWYNDRWYEYSGTTPEQMQGWGWQGVHDPEVLPSVLERWKASLGSGQSFEMVFPLRGADGVFRPHLTRITPVKDGEGKVVRWFGTNTDITEQKKVQEELQCSEALYRATFDNAAVGIAHVDLEGRFLRINDAICTIVGYSREELLTKTFADITHPDDIEADWEQARRLLAGKTSRFDIDKRYIHKDGSVVWAHLTASVLRDERQIAQKFVAVVEDITRRRLAEQALIRSEKLASAGRLASTLAHEINNPLEVLSNLFYLISTDRSLAEHLREHVSTAEAELKRLSHMARRTLSFYRPQSAAETIEVNELVEEVLGLFSPTLSSRDIRVSQRLDAKAEIHGSSAELRQVCINLISNALDAEPDSLMVRVSRRMHWKSGSRSAVCITVADTGTGMDRETVKHIFEPFFTTKSKTGTGLGLWVCHETVGNAGGSIRVRSARGKGSVFSVYLPTTPPQPSHTAPQAG